MWGSGTESLEQRFPPKSLHDADFLDHSVIQPCLATRLNAVDATSSAAPSKMSSTSDAPGGSTLHETAAVARSRVTNTKSAGAQSKRTFQLEAPHDCSTTTDHLLDIPAHQEIGCTANSRGEPLTLDMTQASIMNHIETPAIPDLRAEIEA